MSLMLCLASLIAITERLSWAQSYAFGYWKALKCRNYYKSMEQSWHCSKVYSSSRTVWPSPPGTICMLVSEIRTQSYCALNTMQMLFPFRRILGSFVLPSEGSLLLSLMPIWGSSPFLRGLHFRYVLKDHVWHRFRRCQRHELGTLTDVIVETDQFSSEFYPTVRIFIAPIL